MSAYLYIWNADPNKGWDWFDLQDAVSSVKDRGQYDSRWSCGNRRRIAIGDSFFLMRLGKEPKGIIGYGEVLSTPYEDAHWNRKNGTALYTCVRFRKLSKNPFLTQADLQDKYPRRDKWTPQGGGRKIEDTIASELLRHCTAA